MAKYIRAVEAAEKVVGIFKVPMADLVDIFSEIPAADVAPIEALERLRDELCAQDLITLDGLKKLNTLIGKYTTVHDGGQCE